MAIVDTGVQKTGDSDSDVGLGVVANDGGVNDERQQGLLVGSGVATFAGEERGGVCVADACRSGGGSDTA